MTCPCTSCYLTAGAGGSDWLAEAGRLDNISYQIGPILKDHPYAVRARSTRVNQTQIREEMLDLEKKKPLAGPEALG